MIFLCAVKQCPLMLAPENGKVSCSDDNNFGSVCTFTCNVGYKPVSGSDVTSDDLDSDEEVTPLDRTCQSNSEWTNSPVTCRSKIIVSYFSMHQLTIKSMKLKFARTVDRLFRFTTKSFAAVYNSLQLFV